MIHVIVLIRYNQIFGKIQPLFFLGAGDLINLSIFYLYA
jgi:hypothetical protein